MQFVCVLGWLRTNLPEFTTLIAPLMDILQLVHAAAGGARTKKSVAEISLADAGWSRKEFASFDQRENALRHATSLVH
jgi:hypothetical protein